MASAEEEPLEELVERFFEEGRTDIEGYVRRHPARADELRRALEAMHAMERAAGVFSEVDDENPGRRSEDAGLLRQRVAAGESLAKPDGPIHSVLGAEEPQDFVAQVLARLEPPEPSQARYEFEGEVARGGQGAVLAVWDERLRRRLAMKVTLARTNAGSDLSEALSLGRFLEEAQVTAQLDHPGIVPVHDLGLDAERRVYFTMKLVKGRDLRAIFELVRRGEEGWTRTRALNVLLKVCEAMAYAHSKGVIHRDLKPANVMVGRFGEVYVMDWGLARVLASADRKDIRIRPGPASELSSPRHDASDELDSPLVTMDGDVVGTPAYMPPEQARGEIGAVGPHSDVYAVGAMLYQLLTGEMPYVTSGARLSNRAVWALVQRGPPEPVEKLARGIPAELVVICEKAMAREVAARYRDMSELADDLRAFLEHRVVSAYETGPIAELRKWVQRNKTLAGTMAAVFVAVVAGLGASLAFKARSDRNAARAAANETRALEGEKRARENERIAAQRADDVLRLSALQVLDDLIAEADQLFPATPEMLDRYQDWLERAQELVNGLPQHEAMLAELRARAGPPSEVVSRAPEAPDLDWKTLPQKASDLNELAWPLVGPDREIRGEEAKGLMLARRAVELAADLPPSVRADIRDTLSWALLANGRFDEAVTEEEEALREADTGNRVMITSSLARMKIAAQKQLEDRLGPEDRWWHHQLVKLIEGLRDLSDPKTGLLSAGTSPDHGWGVRRRLESARTIRERSLSGVEAAAKWAEAIESIASFSERPWYGGMRITPQLGLLPIGRDPESSLWEFAHMDSGEPARRRPDGRVALREETGLVLVLLPGGTFLMGAQKSEPSMPNFDPQAEWNEAPVHEVRLSPFFLSKFEMTQAQWSRFAGRNPSGYGPGERGKSLLHPVERVSWNDCSELLAHLGLELPSEAQWEYGARAGTTTPWWTGEERDSLLGAVNLADQAAKRGLWQWGDIGDWPELDDGYELHAPVDRFAANPFGLHNVHGNVWEWCWDDAVDYPSGPAVDPRPSSGRVSARFRGGAFDGSAWYARSSLRGTWAKERRIDNLGVRPARRLTP